MRTMMISALLAAVSVAQVSDPWTIDLRGREEDSTLLVLKSGENFDVLVQSMPTTGYSWQNNLEFNHRAQANDAAESSVVFIGEHEILDSEDEDDNQSFMPGSRGEDITGPGMHSGDFTATTYVASRLGGHQKDFIHSFSTQGGENSFQEIKFGYFRSWEAGNEFPDPSTTADFHTIELMIKDDFKHDVELRNLNAFSDIIPDQFEVEAGDWVRLRLSENPSTGYRWATDADTEEDQSNHEGQVREIFNFYQPPLNTEMLGAAGQRVIIFEVQENAKHINLAHKRPWQSLEENSDDSTQKKITFKMPKTKKHMFSN